MRQPLVRRTAADIGNPFATYRGFAGRHPEQRNRDAGKPPEQVMQCRERDRRHNHVGKTTSRVYRVVEEACRKADKIAWQSETQQLSLAVRQNLVSPDEAAAQNEDAQIGPALGNDIAVTIDFSPRSMEL